MEEKIKKAIILNTGDNNCQKYLKNFDVIYIGSSFCQNIFPDIKEIDDIFKRGAKKIVIQTSFFTQDNIENFKTKLTEIFYSFSNIELSINDLGLLDFLNKNYPKIKKGIGIPLSYDFMRMESKFLNKFMKKNKLYIIETDEDYLIDNIKDRSFLISFHYPLKFMGVSRFCPYTRNIITRCENLCNLKFNNLKLRDVNLNLIQHQNAYFVYKNELKKDKIDRLVKNY